MLMMDQFASNYWRSLPLKKRPVKEIIIGNMESTPFHNYSYENQFDINVCYDYPITKRRRIASDSSIMSYSSIDNISIDSGFIDNESPLDLSRPYSTRKSTSPDIFKYDPEVIFEITNETSVKSIKCRECEKQFYNRVRYRAHLRRHASKRSGRYRCHECQKTFVQRSSLTTHLRIHSGEKPFFCNECNDSFGDFSTFTKHKRIHSGEKPYACPVCERSFSQSGNMHRHLKAVHRPDDMQSLH